MNRRFTLIVFLVFAALAVFAYTQRNTESLQVGEGAPTPTPLALLELVADDIEEVVVDGELGGYELSRVAGGWEVDGFAASDEVDGVVTRLANPNVIRELPADRDPDDYGFATPSLTVTLRMAAGDEHLLHVGDDTPVDPYAYVRLADGERLVIVSYSDFNRLKDWIEAPPLAPTPTPEPTEEVADEAADGEPSEGDETAIDDEDAEDVADEEDEGGALTDVGDDEASGDEESEDEEAVAEDEELAAATDTPEPANEG